MSGPNLDGICDEGGDGGARLEEIRMVADLPQLHQHVDHRLKIKFKGPVRIVVLSIGHIVELSNCRTVELSHCQNAESPNRETKNNNY